MCKVIIDAQVSVIEKYLSIIQVKKLGFYTKHKIHINEYK